jgi:ComF family protein
MVQNNPVEILFWGRCDVYAAAAFYRYLKGGKVQEMIHNFKYKGFQEIGLHIGEKYGEELMQSPRFADVDYIIPVPLHPKKMRLRGFNQSEVFGRGLAVSMAAQLDSDNLHRVVHSATQTRKNRWERFKNVESIFGIRNANKLENMHVLLVDDVITTGSTIEACVIKLKEIEGIKVSVAAIATAAH